MRRILLALVALVAILLAVNTIVTDNETKEAEADIGQVVELAGGDLQVREDGEDDGPTVVMLHGFAGSMHWWTLAAERLANDFHLVRIDLLGHGGSAKPEDGYTIENQARLVDSALAALDVRRAVVAGHSMGGSVATALAERDPSLVDGLVFFGSAASADAAELPFLARLGFVPVVGEAIRRLAPDAAIEENLENAFAPGFDVPEQFVRDFNRMTYSSYDGAHHGTDDYREERALPDRLAPLRKPLLAIQGAEDEIVDPDSAQDYRRVPGARVVLLPDTGHSAMVERPDEAARLIRRFVRRVERRRSAEAP